MSYKKSILTNTALALLFTLNISSQVTAQSLQIDEKIANVEGSNTNTNPMSFEVKFPTDDKNSSKEGSILPENNKQLPILESSPILENSSNQDNALMVPAPKITDNTTNPEQQPRVNLEKVDTNIDTSISSDDAPIPDLLPIDEVNKEPVADDILNQIDTNLFSKMSSIEKQSALLTLELRREKIRSEIEAIKAQRKKAIEEEEARAEERRRERIEWENEQQKKLLIEQQKLQELENQREILRQEKIVKAYKETMLNEKQKWIKHNEELYSQMAKIESERNAVVDDFKMKLNNLKSMSVKTVSNAQQARERYNQAVNTLKTQLSIVQARLDAELKAKLAKNNPFATAQLESQIKLNDVYAIMEIVGKGENLAAKLINNNGDRFLVRKGTVLQTGHIIDEITETYIRADLDGVKDYLFFAAGGILDSEPLKNNVLNTVSASSIADNSQQQGNQKLNTSNVPSLGEGMFVR